jgi:hypothetical protein
VYRGESNKPRVLVVRVVQEMGNKIKELFKVCLKIIIIPGRPKESTGKSERRAGLFN